MKNIRGISLIIVMMFMAGITILAGCASEESDAPSEAPIDSAEKPAAWQWPEQIHITAQGQSGLAKYVSWASILEADTGMAVRVIPEADPGAAINYLPRGDASLSSTSKQVLSSIIEAKEDFATRDGGPFQVRIVWVHDLANAGFFTRGDSDIETIDDIGPGTRFSVWNMRPSTLNPYRSLLAWAQVDEKDIVWADAGDFGGAMRAIAEGRADIAFGFPTSPQLLEVASSPHGIRFLELNAEADPEGARRWQARDPLYSFAPMASGIPEAIGRWGAVGYVFDITDESADSELVYQVARWLDENFARYEDVYDSNKYMTIDQLMEGLKTTFIPVHEGLIKYLEEKGLWTEAHAQRQIENIAVLNTYQEAYAGAIELADEQGIEISPVNPDWIYLWETYKVEHQIPKIGEHVSLTESGISVIPTEVSLVESETTPAPEGQVKATSGDLIVEIISVTDPVKVNTNISVVVKTNPGAECTIVMTLSEGTVSGFPKDPVKVADENGDVIWEWVLFSHTPEGNTKLEVTATLGENSATATTYFTAEP